MERDLQTQNESLKTKIKDLQRQIKSYSANQSLNQAMSNFPSQNKEVMQHDQKTRNSLIEYSPIQTCESLQEQNISLDTQQKNHFQQTAQIQSIKNFDKTQNTEKHINFVRFDVEDQQQSDSNITNSQLSKDLQNEESKFKKSIEPMTQLEQLKFKTVYNSAIKEKNICQECITKMHQIHEMQFLKNKYHREYISLRTELEKVKAELSEHQSHQTPRSSINLIEFYGDPANEQKSQKSSFSFENIENSLLSQRFSLEMEQCVKLIDKLLPLDRKFIQLESGDFKLLIELQMKIEKLKCHLGMQTEPKYLEDLFNELDKSEQLVKKIHEKYKKLFQKVSKVHKEKMKKAKDQFNEVNQRFILVLKDVGEFKTKNQKLTKQIEQIKSQIATQELKDSKSLSLASSHEFKQKSLKDTLSHDGQSTKQKEFHDSTLSQYQKSSSLSESKAQIQLQKYQSRLKNSEKSNKSLQKVIKELKSQILSMKKKYLNDFNQFMNSIIFQSHSRLRNISQQTEYSIERCSSQGSLSQQQISENQIKIITQMSTKKLIQEIGSVVYEIFSYTSWQNDQGENMFLPETETEILQMLKHIKKFAHKFDQWQKEKEKEINNFQKNFLHLLKFFIDDYKISEAKLLAQISKMKDNEPLALYIKKYYSKSVELSDSEDRDSSSFTFGQKSESCKDSQLQP